MKFLCSITISLLTLEFSVGILLPFSVHAQVPATPTVELPGPLLTAVVAQTGNSTAQNAGLTPKDALNTAVWTASKQAIQSITRSMVNWINSGFNGSPAFVTDLQQNLNVLSDTVANNFFQQLNQTAISTTGFNLTSPFQDQVTQQLRENYYKATGSLLGGNQYNLSSQSSNPQAFLGVGRPADFSQGGFNAFFSANSNPANNPFGAYLSASNALNNQLDTATQQRKLEYQVGKGFLSWRGDCSTANQIHQISPDPIAQGITVDTSNNPIAQAAGISAQSLTQSDACYGSPIKTPGSIIESQLENQLGSGVRQLELADSMNEIVSALVGQLVNQVLGGTGLSGISQPSSGGGSSYLDQATNPNQYVPTANASMSTGVSQTITNDLTTLNTYRSNWQKILDAATAAQQTCGTSNATIAAVVTQATAGVAKANAAIQQETAINSSIQAASANTTDPTQITTAITQYQSYLGAATTPSAADESYAAAQSTDTGTGTPASLYTQMVNAKTTCPVPQT